LPYSRVTLIYEPIWFLKTAKIQKRKSLRIKESELQNIANRRKDEPKTFAIHAQIEG
jgi:hypothetical protein